jgi:hypothetical protein
MDHNKPKCQNIVINRNKAFKNYLLSYFVLPLFPAARRANKEFLWIGEGEGIVMCEGADEVLEDMRGTGVPTDTGEGMDTSCSTGTDDAAAAGESS